VSYGWFYVALTGAIALAVLLFVHQLTRSPWGRRLRAMRENPAALEALGGNVRAESLKVYVIGGALAGLSGGILAEFIGAWSPSSWGTPETFLYFTAIIVGGVGSTFGSLFGAALVLGVFQEAVRFLPTIGYATVSEAVQFAALGVLILVFLWFRPLGLFPNAGVATGWLPRSLACPPQGRRSSVARGHRHSWPRERSRRAPRSRCATCSERSAACGRSTARASRFRAAR